VTANLRILTLLEAKLSFLLGPSCEREDFNQSVVHPSKYINHSFPLSFIPMSEFPLASQCKTITTEFINDSLASAFSVSFAAWDRKTAGEHIAKSRIDLSTVRKRLKDNQYPGFQAWSRDMHSIFTTAQENCGEHPILAGAAAYLLKLLDKKIRALEATNLRNYENQVIALGKELDALIRKVPPSLSVECRPEPISRNEDFTVDRILQLRGQLEQIAREGKSHQILAVIRESNADCVVIDEREVDLAHLGRKTLLALERMCQQPFSYA
jgi:hypothetical protein